MVVSATDIFRKLIEDPEYIGREDEARSEAEYRARQHYNNVQALAMASDETTTIKTSAVNSLSSFLSQVINIVKAHWSDATAHASMINSQVGSLSEIPNLPQKTQDFIQSLEESGVPYQQIKKITDYAVHKHTENPDTEFGQEMAYTLATNEPFAKSLGMTPLMHKAVIANLKSKEFDLPNSLTKPTTQPSLLGGNFYGSNSEAELEMPASQTNVNAALKKMGRKETISSGSTGKIKFEGGNSDQWHKFWPGKAQARLYHSMITGNDPDTGQSEESEVVGGGQLQQYTVAQILHGLHHTINHDGGRYDITPEQHQTKLDKTAEELDNKHKQSQQEQQELINNPNLENDSLPADAEEAKQVYANPDNKDANIPHVIYGSYGDDETGIKDHPAIQIGIAHGLCNASGVMTPLAESMMLHAKGENGWGHKQHVFHHKGENVHVISWDGLQDIIDTYKLQPGKDQETQGHLNEQIIKDAVGDYFKDVDNLDEAVNKQSQTWEDKETQPNPEFTNVEGKSEATKKLSAWDSVANSATQIDAAETWGWDSNQKEELYDGLVQSLYNVSEMSGLMVSEAGAEFLDHILENMGTENHLAAIDKLGNELGAPFIKDHPVVKHLKDLEDAFHKVADADMNAWDSEGNLLPTNTELANAMDNLTSATKFINGISQTDPQFNYEGGMLKPNFFHDKLNSIAPNVADKITDQSQHFLGQIQQIADAHPQITEGAMAYLPIDDAPPEAKMAYDAHKFQQQKAPSPETEHSFKDGYGLDSTPNTHLILHQNEDGTYSTTHVTQSSPEKAVELASATQGDKKYVGTITDSSTGVGYDSQKLAEKMIEEKGHGQIHSPQPDQPVATDDSVVSDDTPTKTIQVEFPEGSDNAGIKTEVQVDASLSDQDAYHAMIDTLEDNDWDTSGLNIEDANYYNAEDDSLQSLETSPPMPSDKDSETETPSSNIEASKQREIDQKKQDLFEKVQDVVVNDYHTGGKMTSISDFGTGDNEKQFQQTLDTLHTGMAELQDLGVSASEVRDIVSTHNDQLWGGSLDGLEDMGVTLPSDEPDPITPSSEEDTVTQTSDAQKPGETPAAPLEDEVQTKHNAKKDKVMASIFGDDLSGEDAQVYSEWLDENPKEVAGAYKQHVIGGVLNKIKEQQTNAKKQEAEQVKQEAAQAKQEATEAATQQKEEDKQAVEEANTLPHEPGDLASMDEEKGISVATATSHARDLMAHKMKHEDKMSAKTKKALKDELENTVKYGADLDKLEEEMNQYGDDFGSPEHIEEVHEQDIKSHVHEQKYKNLTSSTLPEHVKAREESFYHGKYNKFSSFDEEGNLRQETHLGYDKETGKGDLLGGGEKSGKLGNFHDRRMARKSDGQGYGHGQSYTYNYDKEGNLSHAAKAGMGGEGEAGKRHHGKMKTEQKIHPTSNKAVGTHHMLDELTPKQQALLDTYREAEVTGYTKGMEQAAAQLEEEGVDMKAVAGEHLEDETPKTGPPDPAVAAKKMAEGYVWHEETRHWIKRDTLNDLQGGLGANDASLVSGSHNDFAHDEDGVPSAKNFLLHGSGNLMGVGGIDKATGKPKGTPGKSGFAAHNDVVETSLANELHNKGHLKGHTGAKKLSNFSHPSASSGGGMNMGKRLGFNGAHKSHSNPKVGTASAIASGLKGFASDAVAAFKEGQAQGSVKKSETPSAIADFVKAYSNRPLHHKKKVRELLEKDSIIQ